MEWIDCVLDGNLVFLFSFLLHLLVVYSIKPVDYLFTTANFMLCVVVANNELLNDLALKDWATRSLEAKNIWGNFFRRNVKIMQVFYCQRCTFYVIKTLLHSLAIATNIQLLFLANLAHIITVNLGILEK